MLLCPLFFSCQSIWLPNRESLCSTRNPSGCANMTIILIEFQRSFLDQRVKPMKLICFFFDHNLF